MRTVPGVAACRFEAWPFDTLLPRVERDRIILPADAVGARSFRGWRPADGVEVPARARGMQLGRFVLMLDSGGVGVSMPRDARLHALDIADECAARLVLRIEQGALT